MNRFFALSLVGVVGLGLIGCGANPDVALKPLAETLPNSAEPKQAGEDAADEFEPIPQNRIVPNEKAPSRGGGELVTQESQTVLDIQTVLDSQAILDKPIDRTKPIVAENGQVYTATQLQRESSLLVLAFEPDIRADYVMMSVRNLLGPEQIAAAKQLALSYDDQFQDLSRERSAILENARDGRGTDAQVLKVQMKLADLLKQIRTRISSEVLTQAQRKESHAAFLIWKKKKEADARKQAAQQKAAGN
ncbi:MAG: hypothetical protein ACI814_005170 [Mariniblastus sp.]|jgi:hypothetical protein